jgi:fatty acid desaturase
MAGRLDTIVREAAPTTLPGSPVLNGVVASTGESWDSFRTRLSPRYAVVWRELAVRYVLIAVGLAVPSLAVRAAGAAAVVWATPLAAVWIGYWVASLIEFMHEAAHFNLHRDKGSNDRLANALICPLAGEDIKLYRASHWEHHLHLGAPEDTEVSYHHAPTPWFLFEAAVGIQTARVLLRKLGRQSTAEGHDRGALGRAAMLRGVAVHGAIVTLALRSGGPATAAAWCVGALLGFPFFTALRQILEHRAGDARADADFTHVAHGPVNRMFGTDLFSRTFGAAGFNRHLLHHWYPAASYTRFDDLEAFLMHTPLAPQIDAARSTYWRTLRQLMRPPARMARR